jgi:dienelactone hydrolase
MRHLKNAFGRIYLYALTLLIFSSAQAQYYTQVPVVTPVHSMIGGFYEALPPSYASNPTQKFPLLIFLHGAGEVGNGSAASLPLVTRNGPPKLIKNGTFPTSFTVNGQQHSIIVLSPQFSGQDYSGTGVEAMINYAVSHYRIDETRIYLTGLSMGGGNTWVYAGSVTGSSRLAATINMCGNSPAYIGLVNMIASKNLPVWAFHNEGDPICPVAYTHDWINKLNAYLPKMNPQAKGSFFSGGGHDVWSKGYDPNYRENNMNVYEWMLQYTRGGVVVPVNQLPIVNAGVDQIITLPVNSVSLNGIASDPDGSIASYTWAKVSGPDLYSFSSANTAATGISNLAAGIYIFRLTVTDNKGSMAFDEVKITVNAVVTPPPPPVPGTTKYINVNINNGTSYSNTAWNNWNVLSSMSSAAFKYADGTASTVKAVLNAQTNIADNSTSYPVTMCPAEVGRFASYHTANRTLTITGLTAGKTYNLELFASRNGATNNKTRFSVGSQSVDIVTDNNMANKAVFTSLVPANGQIVVAVTKLTNYNYINGFTITEAGSSAAKMASSEETALVSVFPNPITDRFILQLNSVLTGTVYVLVTDLSGNTVKTFTTEKTQAGIVQQYLSVNDLKAGEYILTVQLGDSRSSVKIIKN